MVPLTTVMTYEHGELFNTELLHRRMGKTADMLGLAVVTMDSAELLIIALDKYIKNLKTSVIRKLEGVFLLVI